MTLAPDITLAPELAARVRAVADLHGLSPNEALSGLLETILRAEERALPEDEVERAALAAALARSEKDVAAGLLYEDLQARRADRAQVCQVD